MLAIKPDRTYRYVNVSSGQTAKQLRAERVILHRDDVDSMDIFPLLGTPYPPPFLLQKAFYGADYTVLVTKNRPFLIYSGKIIPSLLVMTAENGMSLKKAILRLKRRLFRHCWQLWPRKIKDRFY